MIDPGVTGEQPREKHGVRQSYFNWAVAVILVALGTAWGASQAQISYQGLEINRLREDRDNRTRNDIELARLMVTKQDIEDLRAEVAGLATEVRKLRR